MHHLLVFNNRRQCPHILLYNNMYPLKTSVATPNLYPTPTINHKNPLHTSNHKNSSDINHSPAMSNTFSRLSAPSNKKADFSILEGAKVSDVRVPVLLREAAEVMVDMLGVAAAVTDMNANMNAKRLLEASRRPVRGVDPEAKEVVERVVSTSNALIWDQVPVLKRFVLFLIIFGIILTFMFTAPSSWYLVVSPHPYWRRAIPLDQVESRPLQVPATAYLG
jgi:hypothetical protein